MGTYSEDVKVECAENCGNSPKKQLLKELSIAFANNNTEFCLDWMTDDVVWEIIGDKTIQGINDFEHTLNEWKTRRVKQLCIANIITHGNTASLNGTLICNDNQTIAFCDVYNFRGFGKNAKIKSITSYVIKTKE